MPIFLLLILFPSIAVMVYAGLIVRDIYLNQLAATAMTAESFVQWLQRTWRFKTQRRHRFYLAIFALSFLLIIFIILYLSINYNKFI